ncbi:MAG: hypothetical protein ACE5DY_06030 [Mariprofundaceae bacterium]
MSIGQSINHCMELSEKIRKLVSLKRWRAVLELESDCGVALEQLRHSCSSDGFGSDADRQALRLLEQKQRRLQRHIKRGMDETRNKISMIENAQKKLLASSCLAKDANIT